MYYLTENLSQIEKMQKYAVLLIFWKNFASANFPESVFSNDFTSTKILQQKIHFVFVDVLECVGLLSRHQFYVLVIKQHVLKGRKKHSVFSAED